MTKDPDQILDELRVFCAKYFVANDRQKIELKRKLYSYLGKTIPEFCDKFNTKVLNKEKNIAYVDSLCYVFGDIHGNVQDVYDYENLFWGSNEMTSNFVFLGDYVDRGEFGVEVCLYLFALKMLYPEQFTLVRGNHEVRETQKGYTFYDECIKKFGSEVGKIIWNQINTCFDRMPLAAIIDHKVFCCHGGIPRGDATISDILRIPRPLVNPSKESELANDLMWNDPIESMTTYKEETQSLLQAKNVYFVANRTRSVGKYFTAEAAKRFLEANALDYMIRAHEAEINGYKFTSGDRVITVFSSSNYTGMKNTTACVRVSSDQIQIILIKQPPKEIQSKSKKSKQN